MAFLILALGSVLDVSDVVCTVWLEYLLELAGSVWYPSACFGHFRTILFSGVYVFQMLQHVDAVQVSMNIPYVSAIIWCFSPNGHVPRTRFSFGQCPTIERL